MIRYIEEYGVTPNDYEYILQNGRSDILELMAVSESSIREILDYYNAIGLTTEISKLILYRPDLIIIPKENLEELISKINVDTFVTLVKSSIEDLIILGI